MKGEKAFGRKVVVNDKMQRGYVYYLTEPVGRARLCRERHAAAIRKNCESGDLDCRRKQRQAVLHWAYDSRAI